MAERAAEIRALLCKAPFYIADDDVIISPHSDTRNKPHLRAKRFAAVMLISEYTRYSAAAVSEAQGVSPTTYRSWTGAFEMCINDPTKVPAPLDLRLLRAALPIYLRRQATPHAVRISDRWQLTLVLQSKEKTVRNSELPDEVVKAITEDSGALSTRAEVSTTLHVAAADESEAAAVEWTEALDRMVIDAVQGYWEKRGHVYGFVRWISVYQSAAWPGGVSQAAVLRRWTDVINVKGRQGKLIDWDALRQEAHERHKQEPAAAPAPRRRIVKREPPSPAPASPLPRPRKRAAADAPADDASASSSTKSMSPLTMVAADTREAPLRRQRAAAPVPQPSAPPQLMPPPPLPASRSSASDSAQAVSSSVATPIVPSQSQPASKPNSTPPSADDINVVLAAVAEELARDRQHPAAFVRLCVPHWRDALGTPTLTSLASLLELVLHQDYWSAVDLEPTLLTRIRDQTIAVHLQGGGDIGGVESEKAPKKSRPCG